MTEPHQPDQHTLGTRYMPPSAADEHMRNANELAPRFTAGTKNGTPPGTKKLTSEELKKRLPRGVTIGKWTNPRPKPFFIRHGKPRTTDSFATEEQRNEFAEERFIREHSEETQKLQDFSLAGWREFQQFRARTGFAPLTDIELVWNQTRGTLHLDLTVGSAVTRYLEFRDGENLAADSVRHTRTILERFAAQLGSRKIAEIKPDHIRDWLSSLQSRLRLSSTTLRHHRKDVNTFFGRAMREGWVLKNPCDAVIPPKLTANEEIAVLALHEAFQLFKANVGHGVVSKLALEAFAGLRCSSAARLKKQELDFAERGISLPGHKHKSGKRHYVDGFPPNLWEWLTAAQDGALSFTKLSTYNMHKGQAFLRANVANPGNVLRHSFCTFHLAAFKDAAKTAVLLTHRNPAMLYQHYKGRGVTESAGLAYFSITPASVSMTWEEFSAKMNLPSPHP
jgi:integrase